jgi:hypothetical protein
MTCAACGGFPSGITEGVETEFDRLNYLVSYQVRKIFVSAIRRAIAVLGFLRMSPSILTRGAGKSAEILTGWAAFFDAARAWSSETRLLPPISRSVFARRFGRIAAGLLLIGECQLWMRLLPKLIGNLQRLEIERLPPGHFVARLM